jgi:hypothetical protein
MRKLNINLQMFRSVLRLAMVLIATFFVQVTAVAQNKEIVASPVIFPAEYYKLDHSIDKLRFLEKSISDSLSNGQLTHVYDWARVGLKIAESNGPDSMTGIFNFFIAKAFAYEFIKPDSAIFYYKKVLPFFPDKMKYYNVISVREIM